MRTAPSRSTKRALLAVAAVALLAIGVMIGQAPTGSPPVTPERPLAEPPADRSRSGAVVAAASWLDAVDTRDELLDETARSATISRLVASDARPEIAERLAQAASQLRGESTPPAPVVRSAPLGYRVISFSAERAVVATWEVVARSAIDVPPSTLWAQSQLTLIWETGWKVSAMRVEIDEPDALTASEMAVMDDQFESFRHVP